MTGETSRAIQVQNFFAALVGVGLFGGVRLTTPAKSRWLTTSVVLAFIMAGVLAFRILPRAWELAFGGTWSVPRGMENNDYHKMIRSLVGYGGVYNIYISDLKGIVIAGCSL